MKKFVHQIYLEEITRRTTKSDNQKRTGILMADPRDPPKDAFHRKKNEKIVCKTFFHKFRTFFITWRLLGGGLLTGYEGS